MIDDGDLVLFDLSKDIEERKDQAIFRPDLVIQLLERIRNWEKDVDAEAKRLSQQPTTQ